MVGEGAGGSTQFTVEHAGRVGVYTVARFLHDASANDLADIANMIRASFFADPLFQSMYVNPP